MHRNKWHPGTSEISTSLEIEVGTHYKHSTKTTSVFLPTTEDGFWLLLPGSVSLLSGGTTQPENAYSYILKVTGEVCESQRRISINSNHSYHQLSSPEASLNWSNNKIRFSFNQPSRKRRGCEASWCSKTSIP